MDVSYISAVEASQPVQPPKPVAQRRQLSQAARSVNASGMLGRNQLVIAVDSQTRRPVIRVEDRETHEVVLQIPPEYVLRLAEDLRASSTETMPSPADT
jgi:flagellar protein FlaG